MYLQKLLVIRLVHIAKIQSEIANLIGKIKGREN